jgi:prepilin-type N-terminal cleavage/methylation domain-containing protein
MPTKNRAGFIQAPVAGAGFTLIELLVVISIIALLASILMVSVNSAKAKGRDSTRMANVSQLTKALELYYNSNNGYPVGTYYSGYDDGNYPQSNAECWCQDASTQGGLQQALVGSGIIAKLPHDPANAYGSGNFLADGQGHGFLYVSDGKSYVLGVYLETSNSSPPIQDAPGSCMAAGNYQVNSGPLSPTLCPLATNTPPSGGGGGGGEGGEGGGGGQILTPIISSLSPTSSPAGTLISISGSRFTATGNNITVGGISLGLVASSGGSILTFTVPSSGLIGPGSYPVVVTNGNGASNAQTFTVTADCTPSLTALGQTPRLWFGIAVDSSNKNVYAVIDGSGDIYKQTGGIGNFVALGQTTRRWRGISVDSSNKNVYAVNNDVPTGGSGDIYKQTGGIGNFVALGQTTRRWRGISVDSSNQNVYAVAEDADNGIYKQTGGTGDFVFLPTFVPLLPNGGTPYYFGIAVDSSNQNIYVEIPGGDIYKQTGGVGDFVALGANVPVTVPPRNWLGISVDSTNHNVYAVDTRSGGDIYKQTGGTGNFVALGQISANWFGISVDSSNHNVYAAKYSVDIYKYTCQ